MTVSEKTFAKLCLVLLGTFLAAQFAVAGPEQTASQPVAAQELTFTTKSPEAHRLVQQALVLGIDGFHEVQAVESLRKAVALDPDFAMAHQLLARLGLQASERISEQKKAFETRKHASPNEQLLIEWMNDTSQHHMISAIEKGNELLQRLPHDKTVVYLMSTWLSDAGEIDRSIVVVERSGIADSPGLLNITAYHCAYLRQFDKAFAMLDKYVAAMPHQPNPFDSYGEILRISGQYKKALRRYHMALAIDRSFYSSQFGIADTYSLMGNQERARKEYEAAFAKYKVPESEQMQWRINEAMTYVREGDSDRADQAFQSIADSAHAAQLSRTEADAYRQMSLYQSDPARALQLLDKATVALEDNNNISQSDAALASAQILRAQIERFTQTGRMDRARMYLARLSKMAEESRSSTMEQVRAGADGNVLFHESKYADAAEQLRGDNRNPLSLFLLLEAYRRVGNETGAKATAEILAGTNYPTMEQAVVVPGFAKCFREPKCGDDLKIFNASLK